MAVGTHGPLESRLWATADELRANSKLKSSEYSVPVLRLIFLAYADQKFSAPEMEIAAQAKGRRRCVRGRRRPFACAGIAHEQDVFLCLDIIAAGQVEHQRFVDAGLGREVKSVERLEDGKFRGFEAAFGSALFTIEQFALGRAQEKGDVVLAFFGAGSGNGRLVCPLQPNPPRIRTSEAPLAAKLHAHVRRHTGRKMMQAASYPHFHRPWTTCLAADM